MVTRNRGGRSHARQGQLRGETKPAAQLPAAVASGQNRWLNYQRQSLLETHPDFAYKDWQKGCFTPTAGTWTLDYSSCSSGRATDVRSSRRATGPEEEAYIAVDGTSKRHSTNQSSMEPSLQETQGEDEETHFPSRRYRSWVAKQATISELAEARKGNGWNHHGAG